MSLQTLNLNLALTININKDGTATVSVNSDQPVSTTPVTPLIPTINHSAVPDDNEPVTVKKSKKTESKKGSTPPPPPPPPVEPVIVTEEQKEAVTSAMEKVEQDATSTAPLFPQDVQPTVKKDVPPPPPPAPTPVQTIAPVVDNIEDAVVEPVPTPEEIERQRKIEAAKSVFGNDPALNTQRAPITPPPPPPVTQGVAVPPPPPPVAQNTSVTPPPPPAPTAVEAPPTTAYMPTPMATPQPQGVPSPEELARMENTDMTMNDMWQTLFGGPAPDPNSI